MPIRIASFNLLLKVKVEASDELACANDGPHLFKHEGVDSSPEPYVIQVNIQDIGIAI